jgi:copper homeostasis protein
MALLEICVDDLPGVEAAVAGGADRIELCSALELGGLTPSPALLARAVATGLPVHVMIRPCTGNFVLVRAEVALMADDIRRALDLGAKGVVIGALLPDGALDRVALAAFRKAAGNAMLVLHRAIDLTRDPVAAIDQAREAGFDKVLSSGGAPTAIEGCITLARMVGTAGAELSIIAGSGVRPDNVARIIAETGVREVHSSASIRVPGSDPKMEALGFGGARGITDAETVRRLRVAMEEQKA